MACRAQPIPESVHEAVEEQRRAEMRREATDRQCRKIQALSLAVRALTPFATTRWASLGLALDRLEAAIAEDPSAI